MMKTNMMTTIVPGAGRWIPRGRAPAAVSAPACFDLHYARCGAAVRRQPTEGTMRAKEPGLLHARPDLNGNAPLERRL